jgi:hypothetical protein
MGKNIMRPQTKKKILCHTLVVVRKYPSKPTAVNSVPIRQNIIVVAIVNAEPCKTKP